jgi:predicted transposase YbfD/YdcC
VLENLGPLDEDRVADLRVQLGMVPDPRSRRGRWYPLTAILLMCACAAVSGARSIEEVAEFGQRACRSVLAALGVRRHLLGWRRSPSAATIRRVLAALDGDALDRAVSAYLAGQHRAAESAATGPSHRVIAVDGKTLNGSTHSGAPGRHLLSAVTHAPVATIAQVEVGSKMNETRHFRPLLAPLELAGTIVTFDALHSVKATITWLVTAKKGHYIAVIKTNQPTTDRQLAALPWNAIPVQHTASAAAHGRRESRSIKTCAIADNLGGINFPHARLALRLHRRRRSAGQRETRTTVYAVTSLDAHQTSPAGPANAIRGHWGIENSSHNIRDVTFAEDASRVHTGTALRAMATFRNLATGALKILGADNIAKTTRAIRDDPTRALTILGIANIQTSHGT